jgi:hypothetical protein
MPSEVMSVRVSEDVRARLLRESARRGERPTSVAQQLIDEGLRVRAHPLIRFADGPAGRRARLLAGPDVWELVWFVRRSEAVGEGRIAHAAAWFAIPTFQVEAGLAYYANFPADIDRHIAVNETALAEAQATHEGRGRLVR